MEITRDNITEREGVSSLAGAVAYGAGHVEEGVTDSPGDVIEGRGESASLIGYIFWCSVASSRLTREELAEVFAESALDEAFMPGDISARDAFRRAAKSTEQKAGKLSEDLDYGDSEVDPRGSTTDVDEEGESAPRARVMIREVKAASGREVRHVVREIVDDVGERLDYRTVGSLSVEDGRLTVSLEVEREDLTGPEATILETFSESFAYELEHYDAYAMRRIVRHALARCSPVALNKQGGVYVVPRSRNRELAALERFVVGLRSRGGATVWRVPLVDDEAYREQIEESLSEQVLAEKDALISEMRHALGSKGRLTDARRDSFFKRMRRLQSLVDDYKEALDEEQLEIENDLSIAGRQLRNMLQSGADKELAATEGGA